MKQTVGFIKFNLQLPVNDRKPNPNNQNNANHNSLGGNEIAMISKSSVGQAKSLENRVNYLYN